LQGLKSHFDPQDLFRRYQQYCVDAVAQRLFPEFRSLRAWHFRYVLGSWHSDADLAWWAAQMDETWLKRFKSSAAAEGHVIMCRSSTESQRPLVKLRRW